MRTPLPLHTMLCSHTFLHHGSFELYVHCVFTVQCAAQIHDVSSWRLVVLEFIFTFLFIAVIYGTAVGTSGNGFTILSPLAAGLAIYVSIEAVGPYTGAPLNPARLIGPAVVFFCNWRHFWAWLAGAFSVASRTLRSRPVSVSIAI